MTRAVAKLNISWLAEEHAEPQTSKLDERFLRAKRSPPTRSLPFFPDLHTEVWRSGASPFSARLFVPSSDYYGNVGGLKQRGYRAMPRVGQTLASYLSPVAASSLKTPSLPSKLLQTTSALVGKGYPRIGVTGIPGWPAKRDGWARGHELRWHHGAQENRWFGSPRHQGDRPCAIGRSMAAMVAAERHLWLTLSDIKDKDRDFLLDAPLAPLGLFGDAVESVVDRHREARKQTGTFQRFLPRCPPPQAHPRASSSYREAQRQRVATRAPPSRDRGGKRRSAPGPSKPKTYLRAVLQAKKASKKPWRPWPRAYEGSPRWRGMVFTTVPGARSSPVPSGGRSANPGAPGRSDLQQAYISVSSTRKRGTEMLATPSGVSRAASSAVPCRCAIPGSWTSCSDYTRGQSRETGSLSRPFGSMETTAKCVTMGPADCRERLQNPVRFSTASIQLGFSHSGGPRAGSGNGTRSRHSLEEGGHRGGPSLRKGVRVLQPVLHSSKEGWGVASDFKSASAELLSHATEVQDADTQTGRVSDQVWGLVCHDRSKGCIFPCLHHSHSQEVPEVCFRGQSLPVSGSSIWPSTLTPHFHEVCGCCVSSIAATGHPHTQLHRRLVDSPTRLTGRSVSFLRGTRVTYVTWGVLF